MPPDPPPLLCNLEHPDCAPTFAVCPLCRFVIEDIREHGKSVRDRTSDADGVVLTCEAVR
jgi:hypothetical protein